MKKHKNPTRLKKVWTNVKAHQRHVIKLRKPKK